MDWSYDFKSHFKRDDALLCKRFVVQLRELCDGNEWEATVDKTRPRLEWGRVLSVAMHGKPPVPSVHIARPRGPGKWYQFNEITETRRLKGDNEGV